MQNTVLLAFKIWHWQDYIKAPSPLVKNVFGLLLFDVQNDVVCVQSLILEDCFHIYVLKEKCFSVLKLNLNLTLV